MRLCQVWFLPLTSPIAVGDKKMEIAEDDSKSISSNDVKMDKDSLPIGSGEGRELDVIEEQNENKDEEEDIIMDEEEDFLSKLMIFSVS